mmetsp:Transcript_14799/g.19192  ORF Transcript_14799/g.19192 Transcript_14799/m.19192 type:complete len:346 (+) Transcript_14799:629-1666(+)
MVRFLIGDYQGDAIYRLCEIRGLEPAPKPYKLPGGDKGVSTINLRVKHGAHESTARVDKISNHRVSEGELNKWVVAMRDGRQSTLTPAECKRRHERLKEITTNHTYTADEVRELVARRSKAAMLSGKQNLGQTRLKLLNEVQVQNNVLDVARSKLERLRSNPTTSHSQLEQLEEQVEASESKLRSLHEDLKQIEVHAAKNSNYYSAADKLGDVNSRNKGRNMVVDGEDSRITLQEEFMGTGDAKNDIFRRERTKMNDLWKTTNKSKSSENQAGLEADALSKVFGQIGGSNSMSTADDGTNGVRPLVVKKSSTGLMRPADPDQPRQRQGISLQAYLDQARNPQQVQ